MLELLIGKWILDAENFEIWKEDLNEVKQKRGHKSLIDKIREFPVANKTPVETINKYK